MNKFLVFFALLIILIFGGLYFVYQSTLPEEPGIDTVNTSPVLLNRVMYMCNDTKTIDAAFYEKAASSSPTVGQAPIPNGSVKILLSDGRSFELPQTISADGARYANADETFVFWSKGNGLMVLEDGAEKDYIGCVLVAPVVVGTNLPAMYASTDASFSLRLPSLANANADGYTVNESFTNVQSADLEIAGVKFTIPKSLAAGTNLSPDTYISVEQIPQTVACSADLFFGRDNESIQRIEDGITYSIATSSEAGAGNRYEEIVYALPTTNPCIAVRYMVHYSAIENFATTSTSTVASTTATTEFNRETLLTQFDQIRRSLVVNQ